MSRTTEMNKEIFGKNLLAAIKEVLDYKCIDAVCFKFRIIPIVEPGKPMYASDEVMRLVLLSERNVGNRLLTFEETVALMSCKSPFVPLWINVSFGEMVDGVCIIKLETSLRIRKPTILLNSDTGHPPFKAILE